MTHYKNEKFILLIGARIEKIRIEKNLSREVLADMMKLKDERQLSRIINAETNYNISNIERIATALGVHPKELFDFDF